MRNVFLIRAVFILSLCVSFQVSANAADRRPARIKKLAAKAEKAKGEVQRLASEGYDVRKMLTLLQQFPKFLKKGRADKAEAVLDQVLMMAQKKQSAPAASAPHSAKPHNGRYKEFFISGENAKYGIYDPSLEYAPDGTGWLVYSAVTRMPGGVNIRLAKSLDAGKTWQHVIPINEAVKGAVTAKGKIIDGTWANEVSTLVYDPEDSGREWKLFWHKYFVARAQGSANNRMFSHGWIAYRHAPDPEGPWSEEIALIGAGPYPVKPFRTQLNLKDLHSSLSQYVVLTEPGSLSVGGALYLSFQAVATTRRGQQRHDIILLASPDHGRSWKYVNTLFRAKDAKPYGGEGFTGTSLVTERGRYFIMVCPENFSDARSAHLGTVIFEFKDISKGLLKKDRRGIPAPIRHLKPELFRGGQSDYDQANINGGIIMPQSDISNYPRIFRLFNTNQKILKQ
ncbi:MAG: DUF4185 domain-containing protein [Omnitrophica bacterium]|nr:DUF4185 domain-containing protein [Candidatus Omnitrophota bacterium]